MYNRNHYFGLVRYRNQNPNWLILSADTVTDAETIFQKKNLVTNSMGHFFNHKGPLKPNLLPNIKDFSSFLKISVQFQLGGSVNDQAWYLCYSEKYRKKSEAHSKMQGIKEYRILKSIRRALYELLKVGFF